MSKIVAAAQLIKQLEKLTSRISEIIVRDLPPINDEQLNWRESNEKWSIAECLLHLNYVSEYYFPATLKAIDNNKSKKKSAIPTFQRGWLGHRIVGSVRLGTNNKINKPVQAPQKYNPQKHSSSKIDGHEIIKQFLEHQNSLLQMLQDSKRLNIQNIRVPIALGGLIRIQLGDMLKILVYHTERHVVQAQRILYHDAFPGNTCFDSMVFS
jgi:hypothetical protein